MAFWVCGLIALVAVPVILLLVRTDEVAATLKAMSADEHAVERAV